MKEQLLNKGQSILTKQDREYIIQTGLMPFRIEERKYFLYENN
jgi:hypothetical protein